MAEKLAGIASLIDALCAKHLKEEYREMIHHVGGAPAWKALCGLRAISGLSQHRDDSDDTDDGRARNRRVELVKQ